MQLSKDVRQHLTNKLLLWNATLLRHCCGTGWKAMLSVLLPTFKHVLQQIKVAASCVNTDFWLHKITSLAAKQIVLAWAAQHLQILPALSRTTLYSLQQLFASSNLICCKTGLNVGGKTVAFQLVFRQFRKQDRCQFVARFNAAPRDRAGWITYFFWIYCAGYSPFVHLH